MPMIGQRLGRYLIEAELGAGGMGVVYRASDTVLHRSVAVKIVRRDTGLLEPGRGLLREARAVSALSHPNICTVFEIGDPDGEPFIVMEYLDGRRLDQIIEGQRLTPALAVDYGVQIADALAHAHERGILHRDLKGANVIVQSNGRLKVLDFGVAARLFSRDIEPTQSAIDAGTAAGTLPWMAPEVLGGGHQDARSDLWSLGVLLYEMTSGTRPFSGRTPYDLSVAIMRDQAPRLNHVPEPLCAVIDRCLAKEPSARYERATDVRAALEIALAGRAPRATKPAAKKRARASRRIRSLAVLPLDNLSRQADQEYFADGMTEAIIAELAQIASLRVTSRTSATRYKSHRPPLPEIARALDVDAIVEGSILLAGTRVRITAQLIDGSSDTHRWASSYERNLDDVLGLQREVAQAIAQEIEATVTPQERTRLMRPHRVDPEAHELYLRGRHLMFRVTEKDLHRAKVLLDGAIAKDPNFAPAHAALGDCIFAMTMFGVMPPEQAYPQALAAEAAALAIDPDLSEAHRVTAFIKMSHEWDWAGAEAGFRKALALSPGSAHCHWNFSLFLSALGRFDEAVTYGLQARAIDPLSPHINNDLGSVYWMARRLDEATECYRRALELDAQLVMSRRELGLVLAQQARFDEAIQLLRDALPLSEDSEALTYLGITYTMAGRTDEAHAVLTELKERSRQRYVAPVNVAAVLGHLGARDEAFEWLERSFQERSGLMMFLKVYPIVDPLRNDPRFDALLRRMGLA
jgi:serine/threonine protein kinase/tetratricopeptide (TPR) repeat protein